MPRKRKGDDGSNLSTTTEWVATDRPPRAQRPPRSSDASGSFWAKYKHPNWQRKRLEVMELAKFRCEDCGEADSTLNVHHSYYEKGRDPWDYPTESLHCLCDPCHKKFDAVRIAINRQIGRLALHQIEELLGFARGLELEENYTNVQHTADNYQVLRGMMRVFATLNGHDIDRYVYSVVSVLGDNKLVDSYLLCGCAEEVRLIDSLQSQEKSEGAA